MTICIDASVFVKCLSLEKGADSILPWLRAAGDDRIVAPAFLAAEVASALRRKMSRGVLTRTQCLEALSFYSRFEVEYVWDDTLTERAFDLSLELDQPTVCDTAYLAVAEKERCELWTLDRVFAHAASSRWPLIRLLGAEMRQP